MVPVQPTPALMGTWAAPVASAEDCWDAEPFPLLPPCILLGLAACVWRVVYKSDLHKQTGLVVANVAAVNHAGCMHCTDLTANLTTETAPSHTAGLCTQLLLTRCSKLVCLWPGLRCWTDRQQLRF